MARMEIKENGSQELKANPYLKCRGRETGGTSLVCRRLGELIVTAKTGTLKGRARNRNQQNQTCNICRGKRWL